MAEALGCRGMRVVAVPHTLRKDKGRYGAVMLDVFRPYRTTGFSESAWPVEKTGPVFAHHQEFTLAQVREDL